MRTPTKKSKEFSDPIPVKLDTATRKVVAQVKKKTSFTNSEILRRAVRYAVPKFLSGEVNIAEVPQVK